MQSHDPHLIHLAVWRDFDKGVAAAIRRERRARLLSALRLRDRKQQVPHTTPGVLTYH